MTQEALAEQLTIEGIPTKQNTIAKLENGLRPTTVREFVALAYLFKMSPSKFAEIAFPDTAASTDAEKAMRAELSSLESHIHGITAQLSNLEFEAVRKRSELMNLVHRRDVTKDRMRQLGSPRNNGEHKETP